LANQANSLITQLSGAGKTSILSIGHSQGGLISRDVAHRRFDLVNRIITLDTPNNGAWISQFDRAGLAGAMVDLTSILVSVSQGTPLDQAVGTLGQVLWVAVPTMTVAAFDAAIPATGDLQPGSTYLTNLNNVSESSFKRVGIESASRWRWVEYRLAGDSFCHPESGCGGRAMYNYANGVYYGLRVCEVIAWLFGDVDIALRCDFAAFVMDYTDFFWYVFTSWGDTSDGIVQGSGQFYNGATKNYLIGGADSHVGATKSDKVRATLDLTLKNDFLLIPTVCQTPTVSPSSISAADIGSNLSFTVTTGTGCPWTATSNVPWVTLTSGASGSGSGTVGFAVDINLSPVARTGTLAVTGSGVTLNVTITQAGILAAAAIGSVTINGSEQSVVVPNPDYPCGTLSPTPAGSSTSSSATTTLVHCPPTIRIYDAGTVSVAVNGHTDSAAYGQGSTAYSIAQALAGVINNDAGSFVRAGVMGTTVWVISKATAGANYPLSSATTFDNADFTAPSFTTTNSGATLTGSP